jgi:hypothetical protein
MTTQTIDIPASRRTFVPVRSLGRNVEVETMGWEYRDGESMTVVRSIDPIQPMPFLRPGKLFPTNCAVVPTSSIIVTLEEGTGPMIPLAEETEAEHRDDVDCIRYAGAPH